MNARVHGVNACMVPRRDEAAQRGGVNARARPCDHVAATRQPPCDVPTTGLPSDRHPTALWRQVDKALEGAKARAKQLEGAAEGAAEAARREAEAHASAAAEAAQANRRVKALEEEVALARRSADEERESLREERGKSGTELASLRAQLQAAVALGEKRERQIAEIEISHAARLARQVRHAACDAPCDRRATAA